MPAEGEVRVNRLDPSRRAVFRGGQWYEEGGGASARPAGKAPKLSPQEQIQLKEARENAAQFGEIAGQAGRFMELNKKSGTGLGYKLPFAESIMSAFDPNVAQMDALTARMAPAQRVPGSGTTSDRDLALFLKAVPSLDRPGAANQAIAKDMQATARQRQERAQFLDRFAQQNGTLMGADEAFQRSRQQNPLAAAGAQPRPAPRQAQAAGGNALREAKAAIARGAPRAAVIARLREQGIEPAGL